MEMATDSKMMQRSIVLSPKVQNGEKYTGQAGGAPCPLSCLLTKVLFSGGRELPLLLYEVVGTLA